MAQATFWFASPFSDWIGRRSLTLSWEGQATLRQIFLRLQTDYPRLRTHLSPEELHDETLSQVLVVILDGNFLSLDSVIPDGAKMDVLTPLAGGAGLR
jgi:molybdopterin converting factor small subunit